jgi:hypothetical protein
MTATATAPTVSFINMGTKELVEHITNGVEDAKNELMRRVTKGSRFAIKAAKKLGLIATEAKPTEATAPSDTAINPDELVDALRAASGDASPVKKPASKK